jgi:hypothetical protein
MTSHPWGTERGDPSDAELVAVEAERRDDDAGVTERVQVERAATPWSVLLAGSGDGLVEVVTGEGLRHRGTVSEVGDSWCLLDAGDRAVLVPLGQVLTVTGLRRPDLHPVACPGMGSVLRRWGQMRCVITARLLDGSSRSGHVSDVIADAFALGPDSGPGSSLMIPNTAVRWIVGSPFTDEG